MTQVARIERKIDKLIEKIKCGDIDYQVGLKMVNELRDQLDIALGQ